MRKLTHKEFLEKVGSEKLKEYTILEEYKDIKSKILIRHNPCNKTYRTLAESFILYGCPYCSGKKKLTTQEFKDRVKELTGDEYLVIGEYVNNRTKIKIKHVKCGNYFDMTPSHFMSGNRCSHCFKKKKLTTLEYKEQVKQFVGEEYLVIGEYVNNQTKIKMKHIKCGNYFDMRPGDFKQGKRCPHCFGNHKKTTEQFKAEVFDLVGDEYEVTGEYINTNTHISMKHNKCGYIWRIRPEQFLRGRRCPRCAGNIKKTSSQFKKEVFNLVGKEYSVLGVYKGAKSKILLRHNSEMCNYNEFEMTPTAFLKGHRCPACYLISIRGAGHPNYNPNLTDEDRKKRDYMRGLIRIWCKRVFKKDNYTCLVCGRRGKGELNAHHLNSWNKYEKERFKVNNGVALCSECHTAFHKIYGYGNNTKEQFLEFQQQYIEELKESVI